MEAKKRSSWFIKSVLGFLGSVLYILSLPPVRDYVWRKIIGKGQKKVVDAKARVVGAEQKRKRVGFFRRG